MNNNLNNNFIEENNTKILNEKIMHNPEDTIQFEDEKKISLKVRLDAIESENKSIKQQILDFHNSFKEMQRLKDNEIKALNENIKDLESRYESLKKKNKITEEINSKLTLENKNLIEKNNSLKFEEIC